VLSLALAGCQRRDVKAGASSRPLADAAQAGSVFAETDREGDGTPDFLRLNAEDAGSFRQWFTFLAEAQYYRRDLPPEIEDCAALIRYAYRETLSRHDDAWAAHVKLPLIPPLPAIYAYHWPFTPLRAALFRTRAGPFQPADLRGGAFAEFADAKTIERFNTHRIARRLSAAQPGDLLFFRQSDVAEPFHSMIWLGPSHFDAAGGEYVVYHTGPFAGTKGEIRRLSAEQLLRHPDARWRPVEGNSNFLGIYRWNIL